MVMFIGLSILDEGIVMKNHNLVSLPVGRTWINSKVLPLLMLYAAITLISGCGSTPLKPNEVRVTFVTIPSGAMIYDGERALGTAPIEKLITTNETAVRAGYVDFDNLYAMWPSGAKTKKGGRISVGKGDRQVTFSRPSDAPGLDKDMAYEARLQAQKAQADAADRVELWQMYNAYNAMMPKPSIQTDCTRFGSSISCTSQ